MPAQPGEPDALNVLGVEVNGLLRELDSELTTQTANLASPQHIGLAGWIQAFHLLTEATIFLLPVGQPSAQIGQALGHIQRQVEG